MRSIVFVLCAMLVVAGATTAGSEGEGIKSTRVAAKKEPEKKKPETRRPAEASVAASLPIYIPPPRSAPRSRVGAGTRGVGAGVPSIRLLAPPHTGWTVDPAPTLYWELSEGTATRIELVVVEEGATDPLIQVDLKAGTRAGLHAFRLADYGVVLEMERDYSWLVVSVPDPLLRSSDVAVTAVVRRVEPSDVLRRQLEESPEIPPYFAYASHGIWFDAIHSVQRRIADRPRDGDAARHRTALLEQGGLVAVNP